MSLKKYAHDGLFSEPGDDPEYWVYRAAAVDAELARLRERVAELEGQLAFSFRTSEKLIATADEQLKRERLLIESVRWLTSCGAIKIADCGTFFSGNTAAGNIPAHLAPLIAEAVKP
jgi:hypothetical protein